MNYLFSIILDQMTDVHIDSSFEGHGIQHSDSLFDSSYFLFNHSCGTLVDTFNVLQCVLLFLIGTTLSDPVLLAARSFPILFPRRSPSNSKRFWFVPEHVYIPISPRAQIVPRWHPKCCWTRSSLRTSSWLELIASLRQAFRLKQRRLSRQF